MKILLNLSKVLDGEREGSRGAAEFTGKGLRRKIESVEWRAKTTSQKEIEKHTKCPE